MIQSDNMFGNGSLSLGGLDFDAALAASGRPAPDRSFLNAAIEATDINQDMPHQQAPVVNPMQRMMDVCLFDEDEEAAERVKDDVLVTETARGDVFGQNMLMGVELADMYAGGDVYETAQRFIGALPREQQQAWRDKLDHCHTQSDGQALVGEMFRNGVVEQYRANKARQEVLEEERGMAFNGVFSELVKDANNEEAWNRFREGQARGAFTEADKKSLDSAAKAWGLMEIMMGDYTRSGAAVLMDAESGELIFNELYGDEMAQAVFFNVLQNEVQDLKNDASRRNALERFGRAFAASTNNLMTGVIGGKFKAFVTDEQVDAYNREWERARELSGLANPNVAVYAEGDNWVEKYLLPGNARIDAIRKAAQESGQMNKDGSLRKMTAEERKGAQELGAFRGQLFNAVQRMYDVSGVAAKLGKMMPDSMIFLVPGGMFASAGSMHTQELARQLSEGEDYVSANTKAAVEAGISAAVEKLAFGSLKSTRMAPGLDWLMSRKGVGQALGKIYGTTAGRIGLGVAAGSAEETFAEPLAGLIMRGVYNVAAADELQLADPLGTYQKEMEEMLAPDQILVTGLYGLLLGGLSAGGHHQAANDYREMYEHLVSIGVDEGRAAQAARDDAAVAGFKATKALFDEAVKKDTKGVIAYLAELYPQIEPLNVAENLFSTWQLPHLIPAENGQVNVQEKDDEGKVTETLMSKEAADLLVQARLEQMKSSEIAKFANQLLGVAMAGKASSETDRFIVEEVDGAMDADYFTRLANAAGVRLQQGARADEVAPELHQHLTLGQLVQQGQAWDQRMEIQRNEVDQERARKNLPPLTDEEWAERKKAYVAAVNRQSVRGADGRKRTLLRVSRGHYGAMNVLEDLTEDFIARDMAANNRGIEWYVQNIRELETSLGRQNEFLRELGEGKKPVNQMDIIEAVGKIAQSKLLADTVKGEHGFSAALKSFLEMIRTLILKAAAMLKLGKAINQALTDETVRGKMDTEFLQLVDDVVAQDIEFLRELQLEDGLKAMQRVIAARQEAKADTRVKRRRKAKTPVLDKAEKNHGKKVREAALKKRRQQARVDADVEVAEAALEGDFSSSVENQEELDAIKASAEKDGTFMKAPNGEPTRLTEHQWLQVRTEAFKEWFGDWEKVARFRAVRDTIMSMPIVTEITGKEFQSDGVPLTDKVPAYWQGAYQGGVVSPELGRVVLDKEGVKSSMGHGIGALKAAAFYAVPKVIKKGKVFDRQQNWKGRGYDTAVLAAPISIAGKEYICEVIVEQRPNRQGFYLHEVEVKEKLGNVFKTATQGSTRQASRSILALRDAEVNTIWENCSKVVDENGEPLVVYHGTARSKPISIFKSGKSGYLGPGIYFTPEKRTASKYTGMYGDGLIYEGFVNMRNPLAISYADKPAKVILDAVKDGVYEKRIETQGNESHLLKKADLTKLRKKGYDGIVWAPMKALEEGSFESGEMLLFESNQIKSATDNRGAFDGSNPDITFSVSDRNLAAVHSIPLDTMLQVEKTLGGLAKPSIAITRLDKPYSWGGNPDRVYLVGRPELADPQKGNLVYDRDAWTGKGPFLMESGSAYDYRKGEYFEPTLEAFVSRTIKKKGLEEGSDLRAQSAVQISTMEAVKLHREKLSDTEESTEQKIKTNEALDSLIVDVVNQNKKGLNYEEVAYILAKVCWRSSPLADGAPSIREVSRDQAKRILNEMGIRVKDIKKPLVDKFVKAVGGLKNELEDYLESVPQRAVMFNEFEYAVMPVSARETAGLDEMLKRNGIKPIYHDGTEEGRKAALAGLVNDAKVSFSVSDTLMEDIAMARERAKNADGTISQDGEMSRNDEVELCTMPDFMRFLGEPDVPVVARVFTLRKLLTDHKLTDALTYEVVEKMNDPVLAIQETPSKLLLLLPMDAENKTGNATPVVAIIEHKQDKEGSRYLVSAYPLEDDKATKVTNQFNKLVYCKYNTTAKFTANAPQGRAYDLLRAAISGGHTSNVACKEDVVKWQQDFSSSLVNLDEESVAREVVDAGQGFRANLAYSEAIMREMRGAMQRLRRLGSKTRTDREDAVAAMGTMVQMVKAAVAVLPKGYRFSVHPYLNRIEALAELAATGDIDLTSDIAGKDILQLENAEGVDLKKPYDEMVKEYGNVKLAEALERIMHRVSEQLRKHAKDRAVEKITELVERLAPRKDPKTGKLKGGKMSADAYRDLATVAEAMGMNSEQLEAKLAALRADMAKPGISEELREQLEDEMTLYDQFGDLAGMTPEDAVAAYEALRVRVYFHRFEWDDKQARVRGARRAVVRRVVDGVGSVSENEYNAKKRRVKPSQRLKNLGDILSGMPAALAGMRGYLPLRQMADELSLRANAAGESIKAWEAERWLALEALSKETMGKSWRECMDFMHKVQPSGVSFDRPKFRTVNVKTEELRELLAMTKEERKAEMKRRRETGGLEAERELSERDVQELQKKLESMEEEGRVLSRVETRYMVEVQHEENLQLSRGEALYAILMFEQPTYTERLIMQGYTFEVIEGLREYVGDGMLQFGYGLRELFAKQGDRIAAVYENAFGVPFPREENYFAARWVVNGMKENPAEQLLAGMAGTAGAGNGWMKQRVNHNLELDMTKDALQVFLQATSLTDTWMATQDIVADFKAWTRDADFERALTAVLGKESYDNLKDWIRILEQGGVQDCLNMGVSQDVINGLYGSGAVAILGLRIQTLLKQTPAIFNGLLGAHDISAAEWFATMSRMKNGDAPMTYSRMVNSTLMKMRQQGKAGYMAGQAMRSGDTSSSAAEGLMMASMLPMEWMDARCTAIGLVPVWNVYYQRAVDQGASAQEAEKAAWEQTALVANLASQPIGWLNKTKIAQNRNPIVKSFFYMLSENTAKFALCRALWRGGKKKAAIRAWLVYGAANAAISAMLDALQGDPEEFEKGKWWEYVLSALFYGPASGIPGVGEALEAAVNALLNLTGEVADIDWMKKVKTRASAGRALIDFSGSWKAMKRIYGFMTDNKEHSLAEYTRAAGTVSRTLSIGTGWMGNMFGYWSTAVAVLMNPIDFGARVWRNMKHYWD